MMPGIGHCAGDWVTRRASDAPFPSSALLPGSQVPSPNLLFDALVAWVENGVVPERVLASHRLADGTLRTRPLCAFPTIARWTGKGSSDDAANFNCVDSNPDPEDFRTKYD
jgi:feruloyl esterase